MFDSQISELVFIKNLNAWLLMLGIIITNTYNFRDWSKGLLHVLLS